MGLFKEIKKGVSKLKKDPAGTFVKGWKAWNVDPWTNLVKSDGKKRSRAILELAGPARVYFHNKDMDMKGKQAQFKREAELAKQKMQMKADEESQARTLRNVRTGAQARRGKTPGAAAERLGAADKMAMSAAKKRLGGL